MPNWCNNALDIYSSNTDEKNIINSLFDGTLENRTQEMRNKLRKILLAGIGGVLVPSVDIEADVLREAGDLHQGLLTNKRSSSEASIAYTEFLGQLVDGTISPSQYDTLDSMYQRTGLKNLWWGDIPKSKRNKIKPTWKKGSYDFTDKFGADISLWWLKADLYENTSTSEYFDMQLIANLPINIMVNGFNGAVLNCASELDWNVNNLGSKWQVFEFSMNAVGNYIFGTAWSPVTPITHLIPEFVAKSLGKDVEELDVECDLYFYETGCAFQGVNDETFVLEFEEDDDGWSNEILLEKIEKAFAYH